MPLGFGSLCDWRKNNRHMPAPPYERKFVSATLLGEGGVCTPGAGQKLWGFAHDLRISRTQRDGVNEFFRVDPRGCGKTFDPAASDQVGSRSRLSSIWKSWIMRFDLGKRLAIAERRPVGVVS
jgi:hypothetical protein